MIFGQKMKLIIITIIKHHNSKHYIHSIFINTYELHSTEISLYLAFTNELNAVQKEKKY
jgi:hypothetical protein